MTFVGRMLPPPGLDPSNYYSQLQLKGSVVTNWAHNRSFKVWTWVWPNIYQGWGCCKHDAKYLASYKQCLLINLISFLKKEEFPVELRILKVSD